MMELNELLAPSLVEPPCGQDLSYSASFMALEGAVRGKPEQQFGSTVIAAEPPDWREVERCAVALLMQTKDLRVACLLCRAWLNLQGLVGLARGLELLSGLLDRHWDTLHPLPEDGDHFMRLNALASLDEVTGTLQELRHTELLRASWGPLTVRDAECALKGLPTPGSDRPAPLASLRQAMVQALQHGQEAASALAPAHAKLTHILLTCEHHLPGSQQLGLQNLDTLLRLLLSLQASELPPSPPTLTPTPTPTPPDALPSQTAGQPPTVAVPVAALRSREDAITQLLAITTFIEQTEPTSPAPLLIRRAVKLMRLGFMDILRELSPDSLAQAEAITGVRAPPPPD
jgi:type VI secretion system protein ImpA